MQSAARIGFPVNRLIGNIWSNSDEDVRPAGKAAHGYQAITTHPAGIFTDVQSEIINTVYKAGKGDCKIKAVWAVFIITLVLQLESCMLKQ